MISKETISIVIPVYNVEDYLPSCLDSVIEQTYDNLEIILVDDGSTDTSKEICNQYAEMDSRISVIHKSNGGLSSARNAGLQRCTGELITFIDSDDLVSKQYIEHLYLLLVEYNVSVAVINNYKFYSQRDLDDCENDSGPNVERVDSEHAIQLLLSSNSSFMTPAWGKLYNKKLFDNIRFPEGKIHEDAFIAYKIFHKAKYIVYDTRYYYYYRQRNNSITNQEFNVKRLDILTAYRSRLEFIAEWYPGLTKEAESHYLNCLISVYRDAKKADEKLIMEKTKKEFKTLKIAWKKNLRFRDKILWNIFIINDNAYHIIFRYKNDIGKIYKKAGRRE